MYTKNFKRTIEFSVEIEKDDIRKYELKIDKNNQVCDVYPYEDEYRSSILNSLHGIPEPLINDVEIILYTEKDLYQ